MQLLILERHPLGSQAFIPMSSQPFLVVVAPAGDAPEPQRPRCFLAAPGQGVNYARGIWHHPLIALDAPSDFLVLDRAGAKSDANCDEYPLTDAYFWIDSTEVT
jgi:ureidoglycolate lyase